MIIFNYYIIDILKDITELIGNLKKNKNINNKIYYYTLLALHVLI